MGLGLGMGMELVWDGMGKGLSLGKDTQGIHG